MRPFLAILIVMSLASLQAGGIHLHVNAAGSGGFHGMHIHETELSDHDHLGDTDVSLLEVIRNVNQTFPFIAVFIFTLLVVAKCDAYLFASRTGLLSPRHRSRWRPPLRAPPTPLS
ncbi:MAG: hypothetical protein O3C28_19055 [Proteobacteria bacterium]|nr:hypothetical protein [Pseudomonadota bacterium]